jgi:hypothetical protein
MHATSTDSSANLTAAIWLSLSESSKKDISCAKVHRDGIVIPRSTSVNLDRLGAPFGLKLEPNGTLENTRRRTTVSDCDGVAIIFLNCFSAFSILP